MATETGQLLRQLRRAGCEVEYTRNGHLKVHTPQGPVYMASTPSDPRSRKNDLAELRRHGVAI